MNAANRYGVTALHLAIEQGDVALTRRLLEAGADAARPTRAGETPLMLAAHAGEAEIARALLEHGAAVDARDASFGQTPLMVAARDGHAAGEAVARRRRRSERANAEPRSRRASYRRASRRRVSRKASASSVPAGPRTGASGSRPRARRRRCSTRRATATSTSRGCSSSAARNLELADGNGVTPLIDAILNASVFRANLTGRSDHLAIASFLLDAGANVNAQDWYGETPLWAAVDLRNLELGPAEKRTGVRDEALALVERLLQAGANPNARTREFPHERRYTVSIVGSVAWVDLTGQTPFLRAAAAGDVTVMRLLLEHGADPNIATDAGTTPLMVAAGVNWAVAETYDEGEEALLEAVKLAHELGNDVNAVNSMGLAAIHGAANRGADDVIEYLAANGARLDAPDAQGRTPLDWAAGVFLATHPPVPKPHTIALLERLQRERAAAATAATTTTTPPTRP